MSQPPLSPYRWVTTLWPLAVLFHLAGNDFFLLQRTSTGLWQVPMLVAAIAMLFRPTPVPALVLALSHLPVVAAKMPVVGNHEILLLLLHLAVIIGVLARRANWLDNIVAPLRWVLLISYSAIAFSKLNDSFIDPAVSCAMIFGDEFGDWVGVIVSDSAVLSYSVIALTLLAELAIPVLLMIRPLRRIGIMVGLVFHTLLALEPLGHVYDFTSVLFVLFPLFLAPAEADQLSGVVDRARSTVGGRRAGLALGLWLLSTVAIFRQREMGSDLPVWLVDFPLWLAYAIAVLISMWRIVRRAPHANPRLVFRFAPVMAVVVLLTSLNAASPYLELRTAGAFNMYSNLAVYNGETNHLVLPATLPLRDAPDLYQYNPVENLVIGLDFYAREGFVIPEANLDRWSRTHPGIDVPVTEVTGRVGTISVRDLATTPNAVEDLVERVGFIRPVDPTGPTQCRRYWGPAN